MSKKILSAKKQGKFLDISLSLNVLIVVLLAIACGVLFGHANPFPSDPTDAGYRELKYFTNLSNIFMGFCALINIVYISLLKTKVIKKMPHSLYLATFIATTCVTLTMFVTVLFLIPASAFIKSEYHTPRALAGGANSIFHIILPTTSIVSFVCFNKTSQMNFKETLYGLIPVFAYSIFYLSMACTHIGPNGLPSTVYDWYLFCQYGWITTPFILLSMYGLTVFLGWLLWLGNKKILNH